MFKLPTHIAREIYNAEPCRKSNIISSIIVSIEENINYNTKYLSHEIINDALFVISMFPNANKFFQHIDYTKYNKEKFAWAKKNESIIFKGISSIKLNEEYCLDLINVHYKRYIILIYVLVYKHLETQFSHYHEGE